MKKSGYADLPLHHGRVPAWLADRMRMLGLAITEEILAQKGKKDFLERMSDPFWFQSLGAVMGMDWHSSGITTSVLGALKHAINSNTKEFGIYICGGKGKLSKATPDELIKFANYNHLNGNKLINCSKLTAKVDNTAIQDGFQLYQHNFLVSNDGDWTVIQQGMHHSNGTARRYHWHSGHLTSFTENPHTFIYGQNQGEILNLTDELARPIKQSMLSLVNEPAEKTIVEIAKLMMPKHHDVRAENIDMKRLGTILWLAQENNISNFDELLLLKGLGPRTLQSLALVSEVIYGDTSRFKDPARFSFAHGGKDGHPFPVPIKVYDETIAVLQTAIQKSKLGNTDKSEAIKSLSKIAARMEDSFTPNNNFNALIEKERADSWKYGGKTVFGDAKPKNHQLNLF